MTDDVLLADLRDQAARGQLLIVVGAGVSVAATGAVTASWTGLLRDGARRAQHVSQGRLPATWESAIEQQIESGSIELMLHAAALITKALGGRSGPEYRRWLRESVGSLKLTDASVPEALVGLDAVLATTNYDDVLEQASGLPAVTWRDGARVQRVLRRDERGVLHLHGHYAEPDSVVLDLRSYDDLLADATAQALQRAVATLRSLLFVGFGSGLNDPNFGALRAWLLQALPSTEYRHFRLCLDSEVDDVVSQHEPGCRRDFTF